MEVAVAGSDDGDAKVGVRVGEREVDGKSGKTTEPS